MVSSMLHFILSHRDRHSFVAHLIAAGFLEVVSDLSGRFRFLEVGSDFCDFYSWSLIVDVCFVVRMGIDECSLRERRSWMGCFEDVSGMFWMLGHVARDCRRVT